MTGSLFNLAEDEAAEAEELMRLVGGTVERLADSDFGPWVWRHCEQEWGFGRSPEEAVDAGLDYLYEEVVSPAPTVDAIRKDPEWYASLAFG